MTTLRQGDRGPAALELQTLLAMTGHDPGPLDGVFGQKTQAAWCSCHDAWIIGGPLSGACPEDVAMLRRLPRRAVEVPRLCTPVTALDMRIALVAGYVSTGGCHSDEAPCRGIGCQSTHNAVRVALAQLCVEHGLLPWVPTRTVGEWVAPPQGTETYTWIWNSNIGNRQVRREDLAGRGPLVPWFSMSPMEGSGDTVHRATSAHYAYPNAAEGAAAYWRFLRDHCGPAFAAFEAGDPAAAAHELKHGGWSYSGDEREYARAMVDRFRGIE